MRIRVIIDDVPQDRVNQHPHRFVMAEECTTLDKDLNSMPVAVIAEQVMVAVKNFLHMWGYR